MTPLLESFEKEINLIAAQATKNYSFKNSNDFPKSIYNLAQKIDENINVTSNKNTRAKLFFLKAKALDQLTEYSKEAEDAVIRTLKLDPSEAEAWIILGNILWKKRDYKGAKKAFEMCIENCGKNKGALRSLSVIMRYIETKQKNLIVKQSLELAHEALNLDVKDGESWYILGNAYLTNYFVNTKTLSELKNALKAYNQAVISNNKSLIVQAESMEFKIADLYFNKASVLNYLEEYQECIENYTLAEEMDPMLGAKKQVELIKERLSELNLSIKNKIEFKPRKLNLILKDLLRMKKSINAKGNLRDPIHLKEINEGYNTGFVLIATAIKMVSKPGQVPGQFLFMDHQGNLGAVSIYHLNTDIYQKIKEKTEIYVYDPYIRVIKAKDSKDKVFEYISVQIFDPESFDINSYDQKNVLGASQVTNLCL